MNFQKDQILDRARGAILATAVADALGAGYEFGPALTDDIQIIFRAKHFDLGEYTDDTAMLVAIMKAAAKGDLFSETDYVAEEFFAWYDSKPKDIGNQTKAVFELAQSRTAEGLKLASMQYLYESMRGAGNGSLMRTAAVALPYLSNQEKLAEAADQVSALTHVDLDCREACIIWTKAIRHAILFENYDGIQLAINDLPEFRQAYWNSIFDAADQAERPASFENNGWVISAIQAAYKAIMMTDTGSPADLVAGIEAAVRCGWDTDTVAAIAGGLLGARWGLSAIPSQWLDIIHGWPGYRSTDLIALADEITEPIWL